MEKILFDEKVCVRCGACVSEAEFGGVTFKDGKIFIDESRPESWTEIFSICPTAAIKLCKKSIGVDIVGKTFIHI